MLELEIKKYQDPILREKCESVDEITAEVKDFCRQMLKIMYQENGVGLAAPQVGDKRRIITIDVGQSPLCLINPKILSQSNKLVASYEGCLSLPGLNLRIKRPKQIEVEGYLLQKEKVTKIKADGLLARALQHEIDHLNGVLIIDKISFFKKFAAIKKLKKKIRD
jgi:peptide deformylase